MGTHFRRPFSVMGLLLSVFTLPERHPCWLSRVATLLPARLIISFGIASGIYLWTAHDALAGPPANLVVWATHFGSTGCANGFSEKPIQVMAIILFVLTLNWLIIQMCIRARGGQILFRKNLPFLDDIKLSDWTQEAINRWSVASLTFIAAGVLLGIFLTGYSNWAWNLECAVNPSCKKAAENHFLTMSSTPVCCDKQTPKMTGFGCQDGLALALIPVLTG